MGFPPVAIAGVFTWPARGISALCGITKSGFISGAEHKRRKGLLGKLVCRGETAFPQILESKI